MQMLMAKPVFVHFRMVAPPTVIIPRQGHLAAGPPKPWCFVLSSPGNPITLLPFRNPATSRAVGRGACWGFLILHDASPDIPAPPHWAFAPLQPLTPIWWTHLPYSPFLELKQRSCHLPTTIQVRGPELRTEHRVKFPERENSPFFYFYFLSFFFCLLLCP